LELLAWLGVVGWALTTQIHRRFEAGKALTTTQRRVKRLADAGAVVRVQLHAADGGGVPMCCALGESGPALLGGRKLPAAVEIPAGDRPSAAALGAIRERLHLVGWLLALEARLGGSLLALRGPRRLRLAAPSRAGRPIGPGDLCLPAGRTPRDFLLRHPDAPPTPPEAFAAVTPLAAAELHDGDGRRAELLVDVAAAEAEQALTAALERYDHMLAGWWSHTHAGAPPRVVFVCADSASAAAAVRLADATLTASQAYPGEDPRDWPRPGRERIFFVAERDLHEGRLQGLRVAALPPDLRVTNDAAATRTGEFIDPNSPTGDDEPASWW
jgi:hypothetical protein